MSQNAYEIDLYPTKAQPQLHVDNLYTAAFLRGFEPVPIETASVLEVGCGTGLNLLPMAGTFPRAEFVGVDYAVRPIQIAKSLAERMELGNVRFHAADIRELADDFGSFDYIIVHGFYSWVPEDAREALWRVARGSITPRGVIQISYNCLPGWLQNQWLRDFCLLHMKRFPDRESQLREAWKLIEALASMKEADNPYAGIAAQTVEKGFATAIHDELGEINQPFYLNQVIAHAEAYGFQYLSDAVQKYVPGMQHLSGGEAILAQLAGEDRASQEQYKDFLSLRGFRQSLFTPASNARSAAPYLAMLQHCRATSPLRASAPDEDGNRVYDAPHTLLGFHSNNALISQLFEEIAAAHPAPVSLAATSAALSRALSGAPPSAVAEYWDLVEDLSRNGVLQTSSWEIPLPASVPDKPAMAGIARWEALLGLPLTSLFHRPQSFPDPLHRALAAITDGSRNVSEICAALTSLILAQKRSGQAEVLLNGFPVPLLSTQALRGREALLDDPDALNEFLVQTVPVELERFRQTGLLAERNAAKREPSPER